LLEFDLLVVFVLLCEKKIERPFAACLVLSGVGLKKKTKEVLPREQGCSTLNT
jgi:hypothetical protein